MRCGVALLLCSVAGSAAEVPRIHIPRVSRAPKLADFLEDRERQAEVVVTDFRQFDPGDGVPVSQTTTAYLSYDDTNLYVAFVCKDNPELIRARLARRKDILKDDRVTINIDTFHDHKRAYFFDVNPYGVQMDGITTDGQGDDFSFETLWYTESKITADGYIVLETIPFRSLRFSDAERQVWGIALARFIQRNNEMACWPAVTRKRLPQFVGQFGDLEGLDGISPGRNFQFIPYTLFSRGRFLDMPANTPAGFRTQSETRAGLDTKLILHDSFTLDATLNPDFSQVESDEPQVTVNQRYEVFFPERRPFFTENAQFFDTPEELFFSRRIIDPQFGARLTGKVGRWAIGALAADDRAAGRSSLTDESNGRAGIGVMRIQREFGKQSHIGALVTDREFGATSNRVASLDSRFRLGGNWVLSAQGVASRAKYGDVHLSGNALRASLAKVTRHTQFQTWYIDRSPDFRADLGYIPRVDVRETRQKFDYRWRPNSRRIVNWGPSILALINLNRAGRVQDWEVAPSFNVELPRLTYFILDRSEAFELFRNSGFRKSASRVYFSTEWSKRLAATATYSHGQAINYYPASGLQPFLAHADSASLQLTIRPTSRLRLDESYLFSKLASSATVFDNHIVRSKVNYQFTRSLSLRTIFDYNAVLANASLVSLEKTKRLNADILATYLLHPGTALYVGYTTSYENFAFDPLERPGIRRVASPGMPTGRQFFIKLSYLFRY